MSYGLYDVDLQYYPVPFFNLELMKMSSYYKRKREIVSLSPSFSPHMYSNFIVRQDFYYPDVNLPYQDGVVSGGRAFDGQKYKPLPLEIEIMRPDIHIYDKIKYEPSKREYYYSYNIMHRAEHVRLSLDGARIWNNFDKQLRHEPNAYGIIFHDYDLNAIEGSYDFIVSNIDEIISHSMGKKIGMKYPAQIYTEEDLIKWLQIPSLNIFYSLNYNQIVTNDLIYKLTEIEDLPFTWRQINNNITATNSYEELINGGIQRILRSAINLRSKRLNFPLIYDENVFIDKDWKKVMKMIDLYNRHLKDNLQRGNFEYQVKFGTLYSYMKAKSKKAKYVTDFFHKENLRQIFQFVRENNYDLFKDFYEYRGEEVRNDRRIN